MYFRNINVQIYRSNRSDKNFFFSGNFIKALFYIFVLSH